MAVTTKSPMLLSRQRKRGRESRMRSCISSKWTNHKTSRKKEIRRRKHKWTLYKQSTQAWIFSYQNANYHDVWHQITWGVRGKGSQGSQHSPSIRARP